MRSCLLFILHYVVLAATLSECLKSSIRQQPEVAATQYETGLPFSIPLCSSQESGSLQIGESCLSDCTGICPNSVAYAGLQLFPDYEQEGYAQECPFNQRRYVCAVGSTSPGRIPLCELLSKNSCGDKCECWSSCTYQTCPSIILSIGHQFTLDYNRITNAGCMTGLQRHMCVASTTTGFSRVVPVAENQSALTIIFVILALLIVAGLIYRIRKRRVA